jgi:hypothetical protein
MRCKIREFRGDIAMSDLQKAQLQAELTEAVIEAIQKVGLATFKATSMFGSAGREALSKAA